MKISKLTIDPYRLLMAYSLGGCNGSEISFFPGRSKAVLTQRLVTPSQERSRELFSCIARKPTRQGRLTVTSALKVWYPVQSEGTLVVATVGHSPPVKVIFKQRRPEEAFWSSNASITGGSFRLLPPNSATLQTAESLSFSKSKSALSGSGGSADRV